MSFSANHHYERQLVSMVSIASCTGVLYTGRIIYISLKVIHLKQRYSNGGVHLPFAKEHHILTVEYKNS